MPFTLDTRYRRAPLTLVLLVTTVASIIGCATEARVFDPGNPDDTEPPIRSDGGPTGTLSAGTMEAMLSLETDESASCRYAEEPGVPFADMTSAFDATGGTDHATEVGGLQVGQNTFYVRCQDAQGNTNGDDFLISFGVAASGPGDTTPPALSNGQPSGTLSTGTTQTTLRVTTNEAAACRYSDQAGVSYDNMANAFATTDGTNHSASVSGLTNGMSYQFYVRCRDEAGNPNNTDYLISFSVASAGGGGPISGVRLASGVAEDVNTVQTPSISPEPNSLLLLWVSQTNAAGTNVATASGNGLQWELITTSVRSPPGPRRVSVLRAMGSSPTAGPVTINLGGVVEETIWSITQHTGVATTGTNGSGAIAQFATAAATDFETSALVSLTDNASDGSATVGAIFSGAAEPMTPGAGFQALSQASIGMSSSGSFWLLVEFRDDFDPTVDATWPTPAHWVAIGLELQTP